MAKKKSKTIKEIEQIWSGSNTDVPSDVLGSYTGTPVSENPENRYERPVQDADDL